MCNPKVYEELLAVEKVLIDDYLAGDLSQLEQHYFETHFLKLAERQKNLRFGQLLKARLDPQPALAGKTAPARTSPFSLAPTRKSRGLAISGALVLCLSIVFFSWLTAQKPSEGLVRPSASGLAVVTLSPSSVVTAGTTQLLTLPPRDVDVKLELELTNASFHNYKSQMFLESEALDTRDGLRMEAKGDHHIVPLIITGGTLIPGEYYVKLSGILNSGEDQFIDNYRFRVSKQ